MKNPTRHMQILIAVLPAAIGLYLGWRIFWFLTDDAYIAFRYISNSMLGYGYVWNPPPFLPVEGYTSFLWVVLLDGVWRVFGIEPPEIANSIALFFSYLTLIITAIAAAKISLHKDLKTSRPVLVGLILLGCVINRTYLAWSSSGLETAMFNFFYISWVLLIVVGNALPARRMLLIALAAACIYLTRPDGLLFIMASLAVIAASLFFEHRRGIFNKKRLLVLTPILIVPIHLLWRKATYGEWLPNTYVAKYAGAWPQSGIRYALSFVLEYTVWVWFIVLVLRVVHMIKSRGQRVEQKNQKAPGGFVQKLLNTREPHETCIRSIAILTVIAHAGYYTLVIGGDHFEYRVYSQLIPLMFLSFAFLVNALRWRPGRSILVFVVFLVLSLPIPWMHWMKSRHLDTREDTFKMVVPIAQEFSPPLRWYAGWFDSMQAWLIDRSVCMRHQEHKIFHQSQISWYPPRDFGLRLGKEDLPVMVIHTVGVPSWSLPNVNMIDALGLNDYVIARSPFKPGQRKIMAHGRSAPDNYLESYYPNVMVRSGHSVEIIPRNIAFTAERIEKLERDWRNWLNKGGPRPEGIPGMRLNQ
jgi:arabinofuranosyltransferase